VLPLLKGNIFGRVLLRTSLPHPVTDLQKDQQTCQKKRGRWRKSLCHTSRRKFLQKLKLPM